MRRLLRFAPLAWLVLLLALPGTAWLAGMRQPVIGNTPKAEFPRPASLRALGDEALYRQTDAALLDRLPLRRAALETRGRIAVHGFRDSTHPDVHLGDDGWLFYLPELATCDEPGAAQAPDALEIIAGTILASGRNGGVAVAGSKMVAEREQLGQAPERLECIARYEATVHDRLARVPGGIDLQGELDRQRRLGRHVFLEQDTHWNGIGRLAFARAVLERIRPGMAREAGLGRAPSPLPVRADLGRFLGLPLRDPLRPLVATRTPRPAGPVLLIGDSQLEAAFGQPGADGVALGDRVLPGQPRCHPNAFASGDCDDAVRGARHLIIETVARDLPAVPRWCARMVGVLGEQLRGARGRWHPVGGLRRAGGLPLTPAGAHVTVAVPGAAVSRHARLLRIPVRRLAADPAGIPPAVTLGIDGASAVQPPCVTPSQDRAGEALFVPVPAGADVRRLSFWLAAPAGSAAGPPEVVELDGRARTAR